MLLDPDIRKLAKDNCNIRKIEMSSGVLLDRTIIRNEAKTKVKELATEEWYFHRFLLL